MAFFDPVTVGVFLLVLSLAWYFYPRKKFKLPPGPIPWPIIGSTIDILRSKHGQRLHLYLNDLKEVYGDIVRLKTVVADMIVVHSAEAAKEFLVTKSTEYAGRFCTYSLEVFTEGRKDIALADYGETLRLQRKLCSAALRNFLSGRLLEEKTHASLEKSLSLFDEKVGRGGFNPKQMIAMLVYNVICGMCFSTNFDFDDPDFNKLFNASTEINEGSGLGVLIKDFVPLARYLPFKFKAEKELLDLVGIHLSYIKNQMKQHKESFDPDNVRDLIDHLMKADQDSRKEAGDNTGLLTETHYRQTIEDMFTGGTDTTSYTLYWILLLMAAYPDIQQKVQEDIDTVVGGARFPGIADKLKLPYCEAVMNECMRYSALFPIILPRKTLCDTTLGDYEIPKDTSVAVNQYSLNFDPKEWNNPEDFDPKHFLDDEGKLLPKPPGFLPFGAGKRVCIGEAVAKPEIFMLFTALLQRYKFSLADDTDIAVCLETEDQGFIRIPKPYNIQIERRT